MIENSVDLVDFMFFSKVRIGIKMLLGILVNLGSQWTWWTWCLFKWGWFHEVH